MRSDCTLSNVAQHVAVTLARELTAGEVSSPPQSLDSKGGEEGVVLRGDKVVYIPGSVPDLEHLESKYGRVGAMNQYEEQGNSPGLVKVVIMNFND